jgi:twitching motility protein PilU
MAGLTEEQAKAYIIKLLTAMSKAGGSDLFVSKDFPPAMKFQGAPQPLTQQKLTSHSSASSRIVRWASTLARGTTR